MSQKQKSGILRIVLALVVGSPIIAIAGILSDADGLRPVGIAILLAGAALNLFLLISGFVLLIQDGREKRAPAAAAPQNTAKAAGRKKSRYGGCLRIFFGILCLVIGLFTLLLSQPAIGIPLIVIGLALLAIGIVVSVKNSFQTGFRVARVNQSRLLGLALTRLHYKAFGWFFFDEDFVDHATTDGKGKVITYTTDKDVYVRPALFRDHLLIRFFFMISKLSLLLRPWAFFFTWTSWLLAAILSVVLHVDALLIPAVAITVFFIGLILLQLVACLLGYLLSLGRRAPLSAGDKIRAQQTLNMMADKDAKHFDQEYEFMLDWSDIEYDYEMKRLDREKHRRVVKMIEARSRVDFDWQMSKYDKAHADQGRVKYNHNSSKK